MIRRWLHVLLGRSRFEEEMRREMEAHVACRVDDLVAGGVPRAGAERQARIEFGATEAFQEECREQRGLRPADELLRNLRYAGRILRKSPGFTATAVITLGLCIGANTAIFSVVDAVIFRPLPYPEPDRLGLVVTEWSVDGAVSTNTSQDGAAWKSIREAATRIDVAAFSGWPAGVNFAAGDRVERVLQQRVGAGFFRVLGVPPRIGRGFDPDEDRPGGPPVAVLSHELWRRALDADPSALGGTILLRGEPYTVAGVMPPGFRTSVAADLWTPLRPDTSGEGGGTNYAIVARVRDGVTWESARGELAAIGRARVEAAGRSPEVEALGMVPLGAGLSGSVRSRLLLLWGAVGMVLLIGCVNIAGLLLARAAGRARELATRMALGGGRAAILRQLVTESLVLAGLGGLAGAAVGYAGIGALRTVATDTLGIWQEIRLDGRVLLATALLALLTSLLFGLLPALRTTRIDLRPALAEGVARGVAGPRSRRSRAVLVIAEVALGVMLLVGAGLMLRSLFHLHSLRPGFDATGVLTADVSLQDARYRTTAAIDRLARESLAAIRRIPGVEHAAIGLSLPYERPLNTGFRVAGETEGSITNLTYVTPEYFAALRIPLLRGRGSAETDRAATPAVVLVNQAFVDEHFRDEEVIGARIEVAGEERTVVGIAGDVQQRPGWGDRGPLSPMPGIYMPLSQAPDDYLTLVHTWFDPSWIVRASGPRQGLIAGMQRALESADPRLPFAGFRSLDDVRAGVLALERFQATALALLAGLALLLSALGIGGLIAGSVTERTRELGIRMALGSTVGAAMRTAAMPGLALALAGTLVGTLLAQLVVGALRPFLHGIVPRDALTFAGVAGVLMLVAAAASFLPARRIGRLDPVETLREE